MPNPYLENYAWPVLPLVGLISAVISMAMPGAIPVIGFVFGFLLALYFAIFWGLWSVGRIALLIGVSTIAYPCAYFGSVYVMELPWWMLYGAGSDSVEVSIVFAGGLIGGFMLAGSIPRIFGSSGSIFSNESRFGLLGALVSAVLGVIGWQLGPSLGKFLWALHPSAPYVRPDSYNFDSLYLIWQPGMAFFLGIVAAFQDRVASGHPRESSVSPVGQARRAVRTPPLSWEGSIITAAVVIGLLLAVVLRPRISLALSKYEAARRMERRTEQRIRETPSMERLPQVAPMSSQQAFILGQIGGVVSPLGANTYNEGEVKKIGAVKPFDYFYELTYFPPGAITSGSVTYAGAVRVTIRQYPNSEWAAYLAKYPPDMVDLPEDSKLHMRTTKFQNIVWSDVNETGLPVQLYYQWPSANDVVTINYVWPYDNSDEFLRRYLEKYPSSLK